VLYLFTAEAVIAERRIDSMKTSTKLVRSLLIGALALGLPASFASAAKGGKSADDRQDAAHGHHGGKGGASADHRQDDGKGKKGGNSADHRQDGTHRQDGQHGSGGNA
jgi:hypothetical protein